MTDLRIPDEAVLRLQICDQDAHMHDRAETCVRAIAAPVVSAELRRLAGCYAPPVMAAPGAFDRGLIHAHETFFRGLLRRAADLDPSGGQQLPADQFNI